MSNGKLSRFYSYLLNSESKMHAYSMPLSGLAQVVLEERKRQLVAAAHSWITQLDGQMVFVTADGNFDHNV